jgi:hypothetical protein
LGGYAVATVLGMEHNVKAVVSVSGFDTPEEQWQYSVNKYTGLFYSIIKPFNSLFISLKYGTDMSLSVVEGINNVSIPVMVISAEDDSFYGGFSPIYDIPIVHLYLWTKKITMGTMIISLLMKQ